MHVLIVDHKRSVRGMVRSELRQLGVGRILEAEDGLAALDVLQFERIDLVVTDLDMPRLDGVGLLREMRQNPRTQDIPAVVLTAAPVGEVVAQAAQLGVIDVIAKPFTMGGFAKRFSTIAARLRKRGAAPAPSPASPAANAPPPAAAQGVLVADDEIAFEID